MIELCKNMARIAQSNASVLVTGESGTGKELIAKAIHYNSHRANGPLIKVNCAALPESLLESELFGHEKGAFTGAAVRHTGRFERAHTGTLLLDEIGEISNNLQVKLLRVLQEREFERVGGTEIIKTDIRIIASTNQDLEKMVQEGKFRQDLFFRLNVAHLHLPPLRERREDVQVLSNYFLHKFCTENHKEMIGADEETMALLQQYDWPGNVRELANVMERAVVMSVGPVMGIEDLPESFAPLLAEKVPDDPLTEASGKSLREQVKAFEKNVIIAALQKTGNNKVQAAKELAISRRTLMYKLQEYGL
jgi:two-component system response regulator AtoC